MATVFVFLIFHAHVHSHSCEYQHHCARAAKSHTRMHPFKPSLNGWRALSEDCYVGVETFSHAVRVFRWIMRPTGRLMTYHDTFIMVVVISICSVCHSSLICFARAMECQWRLEWNSQKSVRRLNAERWNAFSLARCGTYLVRTMVPYYGTGTCTYFAIRRNDWLNPDSRIKINMVALGGMNLQESIRLFNM